MHSERQRLVLKRWMHAKTSSVKDVRDIEVYDIARHERGLE